MVVKREEWNKYILSIKMLNDVNITGVIVVDQARSCEEDLNNVLHYDCFRPSYPTSDIS